MYEINYTPEFIAAVRRCKRSGRNLQELWDAIELLAADGYLPESYRPHQLRDEWIGCWECHLDDDWLLVWRQYEEKMTLLFVNVGTHDDLFKKHSIVLLRK